MTDKSDCPCRDCPAALTCWWTCDKLSEWAEDKTFAQVADEFIAAYNSAEKAQKYHIKKPA